MARRHRWVVTSVFAVVQAEQLQEERQRVVDEAAESARTAAQAVEDKEAHAAALQAALKAREEEVADLEAQVDLLRSQGAMPDPESWLLS
jgi:hypothetical protein